MCRAREVEDAGDRARLVVEIVEHHLDRIDVARRLIGRGDHGRCP